MGNESPFSLAQLVGYVVLLLGVTSFLQRDDRRLKIWNTLQCVAYCIHFILMGNLPAASSNVVSAVRNLISLKTRSIYAMLALAAVMLFMGLRTIKSPAGFIPVVATFISIYGMFRLEGIKFRLCMLLCTGFWLTNNILSHSYGGMTVESLIGLSNSYTILRMHLDGKRKEAAAG